MQKYTTLFFLFILLQLSVNGQDKAGYREKFTEGNYLVLEGNYARALKAFLEAYKMDSSSANINFKIGFCYLKTVSQKNKALPYLERAVTNTKKSYVDMEPREKAAPVNAYYYYGEALHLNYKFDEAIANYEKFKSYLKPAQVGFIKDVDRHIEISNNAKILVPAPIPVNITNLGDSINTTYADHSPVISADENTLIFTSRRPGSTGGDKTDDDEFFEDIYVSYRKADNSWSTPVSVSPNINTRTHEASVGLTADAQTLLIYKDMNGGDIYFSTLDGNNWTFPQQMGSDINTPSFETSACLSPDGNTLYFVSDRKEGSMGGRDIWKCVKLPNGKWSKAVNVGAPINTPYDEESPFIHPSGNVLFFSSKGHQSIGGFDIFFSSRNDENGWDEPLNIGYPINTTDDDICYVTSPDGKRGYYSSAYRAEGYGDKDIYMISIPERKEQPLVLIKGVITPAEGTALPNTLEIVATNNETGIVTGVYKPLMRDGSFTIIIPPGSNYTLSYQQDGQEFYSEQMEVPMDAAYQEINKEVTLKSVSLGQPAKVTTTTKESENKQPEPAPKTTAPAPEKEKAPAKKAKPVKKEKASPKTEAAIITPHEQLATVDKLDFKMDYKYNISEIDVNDVPFKQFIDNMMELYTRNGVININIESSASQVPTRSYNGSNEELAALRGEKGKQQLLTALKEKGVDESKIRFVSIKASVGGPEYNIDYEMNKEKYEAFQFIKMNAY